MNVNGNFLISILSERLSILANLGTKLFMTQMFKAKTFKLNSKLILNLISMLFKITSESKYPAFMNTPQIVQYYSWTF